VRRSPPRASARPCATQHLSSYSYAGVKTMIGLAVAPWKSANQLLSQACVKPVAQGWYPGPARTSARDLEQVFVSRPYGGLTYTVQLRPHFNPSALNMRPCPTRPMLLARENQQGKTTPGMTAMPPKRPASGNFAVPRICFCPIGSLWLIGPAARLTLTVGRAPFPRSLRLVARCSLS
jgi:hypothetical protein